MSVRKLIFRLPLVAVTVLCLLPICMATGCLDLQFCHCDEQNTLRCMTSSESELRSVTSQLSASPRLRLADLVVRGLPTLPGRLFRGSRLHGLLLSGSQATSLPEDLLEGLEDSLLALGLGENQLEHVPTATLRRLEKLERLDLSGNQLPAVEAEAFISLRQLAELNLADNQISGLAPTAFSSLPRLTTLSLEGNQLGRQSQQLSVALSQLTSLESLSLDNNGISGALTGHFLGGLGNLRQLTLAQNNLTSVEPDALAGLSSLRTLDLSQNKIDLISDRSFVSLTRLETLRLDMNHIVTLPSSGFSGLKALTSLDLSHNFLQSVTSEALVVLSKLRQLFLRDNDIIFLDGKLFDSLLALKRLDLSENPLHCDCRLAGLAKYLATSRKRLSQDDLSQVTCMTPSHLENAPLTHLSSDQLTCEDSPVQYDSEESEPRLGDASSLIRLQSAQLAEDGGGARLRWLVDSTLWPYRCDHVFVFEQHAKHVASVVADCAEPEDPSHLQLDVRWPGLRTGQPYRFCLVLEGEHQPASAGADLPFGCGKPVRLAAAVTSEVAEAPAPPPLPELAAFFANMTAAGRVTVFLRVLHAPPSCTVTVRLLHGQLRLTAKRMDCKLPLLALETPGRPGARACVTAPSNGNATDTDDLWAAPEAQCVKLRPAGAARWWQTAPAAVALGCLLALLLVSAAGAVYCRLHGRCRLGGRYNKWAGRPGVGFVRTATQARTGSEENIHKEQEETDSQV